MSFGKSSKLQNENLQQSFDLYPIHNNQSTFLDSDCLNPFFEMKSEDLPNLDAN